MHEDGRRIFATASSNVPRLVDGIGFGKYRQTMEDHEDGTAPSREPVAWIRAAPAAVMALILLQRTDEFPHIDGHNDECLLKNHHFPEGGDSVG